MRGLVGVVSFYLFYAALDHIPMMDAMMHVPVLRQAAKDPTAVLDGRLGQGAFKQSLRLAGVAQLKNWSLF